MSNTSTQRKKIAALYLQLDALQETLDNCHALLTSLLSQTNPQTNSEPLRRRALREAAKNAR